MNRNGNNRVAPRVFLSTGWPGLGVLFLWACAFSVSCRLSWLSFSPAGQSSSVMASLFRKSRSALGLYFEQKADQYFHKGIGRRRDKAFEGNLFQTLHRDILPLHRHAHASGKEVREMMPWLALATRADPLNTEIYLVAAFWLAADAGRPELALRLLREGQRQIPFSADIQLEIGRLLLRQNQPEEARKAFLAGLAFARKTVSTETENTRASKSSLLLYNALLHEAAGEKQEAIDHFREILTLFPERTVIRNRIRDLESGEGPSLLPAQVWNVTLSSDEAARAKATCDHEDHDHQHDHDHE